MDIKRKHEEVEASGEEELWPLTTEKASIQGCFPRTLLPFVCAYIYRRRENPEGCLSWLNAIRAEVECFGIKENGVD